jgi:hypothetical protein
MSAQLCGCDLEQDYVCQQHRESIDQQRAAWARTMRINADMTNAAVPQPPQMQAETGWESITAALEHLDHSIEELLAERKRIAETLRTFYLAPISMSSVQPILALAVEMNQGLK